MDCWSLWHNYAGLDSPLKISESISCFVPFFVAALGRSAEKPSTAQRVCFAGLCNLAGVVDIDEHGPTVPDREAIDHSLVTLHRKVIHSVGSGPEYLSSDSERDSMVWRGSQNKSDCLVSIITIFSNVGRATRFDKRCTQERPSAKIALKRMG